MIASLTIEKYFTLVAIGPFLWAMVIGLVLLIGKPKNKNILWGYKSHQAMLSEQHFTYANHTFYSFLKMGFIGLLMVGLLCPFGIQNKRALVYFGISCFYFVLVLCHKRTEKKLTEKKF